MTNSRITKPRTKMHQMSLRGPQTGDTTPDVGRGSMRKLSRTPRQRGRVQNLFTEETRPTGPNDAFSQGDKGQSVSVESSRSTPLVGLVHQRALLQQEMIYDTIHVSSQNTRSQRAELPEANRDPEISKFTIIEKPAAPNNLHPLATTADSIPGTAYYTATEYLQDSSAGKEVFNFNRQSGPPSTSQNLEINRLLSEIQEDEARRATRRMWVAEYLKGSQYQAPSDPGDTSSEGGVYWNAAAPSVYLGQSVADDTVGPNNIVPNDIAPDQDSAATPPMCQHKNGQPISDPMSPNLVPESSYRGSYVPCAKLVHLHISGHTRKAVRHMADCQLSADGIPISMERHRDFLPNYGFPTCATGAPILMTQDEVCPDCLNLVVALPKKVNSAGHDTGRKRKVVKGKPDAAPKSHRPIGRVR